MNETLLQLHRAHNTPLPTLCALVARATGQTPQHSEQIIRGYENEVHRVATDRAEFYVRIGRNGALPLAQEAWAMDQARSVGVPVPEILSVETIEIESKPLEAMVQAPAPGRPLSDLLPDLDRPSTDRILTQIGDLLARIHSIPAAGCGLRQADGSWEYPDWRSWITREAQRRQAAEPHLRQAGFTQADIAFMLDQLNRYPDRYPCPNPVLCHGDIEPDHLFFGDDLQLTALIDFGQTQGNSPLQDFIYLSFYLTEEQLESIVAGYPPIADFDHRLHLQRLAFLMGCVAHVIMKGDENVDKTPDALEHLRTTLTALRQYGV